MNRQTLEDLVDQSERMQELSEEHQEALRLEMAAETEAKRRREACVLFDFVMGQGN